MDKEEKRKLLLCSIFYLNDIQSSLRHLIDLGPEYFMSDNMDNYMGQSEKLYWVNDMLFSAFGGHMFKGSEKPEHLDKRLIADQREEIDHLRRMLEIEEKKNGTIPFPGR